MNGPGSQPRGGAPPQAKAAKRRLPSEGRAYFGIEGLRGNFDTSWGCFAQMVRKIFWKRKQEVFFFES